jgi:hypothetical protein
VEVETKVGQEDKYERYPENAPGPFYVQNGCCTACMAPHAEAPSLMGFDEQHSHCYFRKQPQTNEETYRAIRAVWSSELDCLRYAGDNPQIQRRLAEVGAGELCDKPLPAGTRPGLGLRNHVTFVAKSSTEGSEQLIVPTLHEIATLFKTYFTGQGSRFTATEAKEEDQGITFFCSWSDEQHALTVTSGEPDTNRILISHSRTPKSGSTALSLMLDDWLRSDGRYKSIRWYTLQDWLAGQSKWQGTPV